MIGKMGDRHALVDQYDLPDTYFLPYVFAPFQAKVMVLTANPKTKTYKPLNSKYPFLKSLNGTAIEQLLKQIEPEEVSAPPEALFTRTVRKLRDIELWHYITGQSLTQPITWVWTDGKGLDTTQVITLVTRKGRSRPWNDLTDEDIVKVNTINSFFELDDDGIAYLRIPDMFYKEEAPLYFDRLHAFMDSIRTSKALIIDVRGNGGGVRDLIWELAGYVVHPDSVYVVNAVRQRTDFMEEAEWKADLHHRSLFAKQELDQRERKAVETFQKHFTPTYALPDRHFSPMHFALINGRKLSKGKYQYQSPVYVLINERSFSAASVLAAAFKGLPNIKLAGVTTDGSSGNSERFELPHSKLRVKISTMVSFQKDGQLLNGTGTAPDLEVQRRKEHLFWKEDTQLQDVKAIIREAWKN